MIYIVSGDIESGKSNFLLKWSENRKDVFGLLTPRTEFNIRYLLNVATKESFKMQADAEEIDVIIVGRYRFLETAFRKGNEILQEVLTNHKSGYIIIDEVGKLELQSRGFHKSVLSAIAKTINNKNLHLILVVRTSLLIEIIKNYNITNYQTISIEASGELNF